MRKRRRYYEPEDLGYEQDLRDAADPNRRYYVYVLDTDFGHYVGHTAHVGRRLREHQDGATASTTGGNPTLAWRSGPLETREAAASFEAALKSLRDQRSPRFHEIHKAWSQSPSRTPPCPRDAPLAGTARTGVATDAAGAAGSRGSSAARSGDSSAVAGSVGCGARLPWVSHCW